MEQIFVQRRSYIKFAEMSKSSKSTTFFFERFDRILVTTRVIRYRPRINNLDQVCTSIVATTTVSPKD